MEKRLVINSSIKEEKDGKPEILAWLKENGSLKANGYAFYTTRGQEYSDGNLSLILSHYDEPREEYDWGTRIAEIDLDLPQLVSLINQLVKFLPRNLVYSNGKKEEKDGT